MYRNAFVCVRICEKKSNNENTKKSRHRRLFRAEKDLEIFTKFVDIRKHCERRGKLDACERNAFLREHRNFAREASVTRLSTRMSECWKRRQRLQSVNPTARGAGSAPCGGCAWPGRDNINPARDSAVGRCGWRGTGGGGGGCAELERERE
jgi:hypothetical protein